MPSLSEAHQSCQRNQEYLEHPEQIRCSARRPIPLQEARGVPGIAKDGAHGRYEPQSQSRPGCREVAGLKEQPREQEEQA
jgi:hypothetical protein